MPPSLLSSVAAVAFATALVAAPTAAAGKNSTAAHAPFGTIKSKPGECVVGDPNTYISPKDLQWIWDNRMKSDVESLDNWAMDHIVANKGTLNYCVRWDSQTISLTKENAKKIETMLNRQYAAWNHWLIGYDCWPYDEIKVNIVGWAGRKASDFEWSDDSLGKIYIGDLDQNGVPQCPQNCYRTPDGSGGWSESSGCEGEPFDISVWPTEGMTSGLGKYDFQQYGLEIVLEHMEEEQFYFAIHETGHSFGLPNFYEMPQPPNFKPCVMWALSSMTMKDTDGWMIRRVLENKKHKYDF
ncbi:hypothetical protein PHYSODRAFT_333116 [Phytophthora sojae]|uniref:Neutral zinc metallopeptidase, Zn-binding site n=1 Tax=Phytophthora sojae (strain P6497) TaxID=1094619 RepID=G4ZQ73_PHYSP|nr:hypothetical protein PHYSODRAFT_333072 [Phytophthora sojae]XP_009528533.1 hypothetical protein PHYSODRAFT_333116 [Phytophthora sojae]EGZ14736.1 hypothetical protein PHYSODRAFT_333072 [Phytophthora sojae]EGZ14784.1 hypothetical protein PHYSODRAFT_333116 [Phytophthora sojae]|eukprot:XP_009528485.1 hypothetical protein PHYSODRAFT_333072 [Phytophthora sojae]